MEQLRITDMDVPVQTDAMNEFLASLEGQDISLEKDILLGLAKEQLDAEGIPIDIDDGLLDRFDTVFKEAEANAPMHQGGRFTFQQLIVGGIIINSRMNAIRKQNPEIIRTQIKEPLVVAGMPRSGTTHLLQLLAVEDDFITIKEWETVAPFPTLKMLSGEQPDTRIEDAKAAIEFLGQIAPYQQYLYDVSPEEHTEEIGVLVHSCYTCALSFFGDLPDFDHALYNQNQIPGYMHMHRVLQTLSWAKKAKPTDRWLLKSPQHLGALPSLNTIFPDAKVVFTHRDPASIFASLLTLTGYPSRRFYSSMSKQQLVDRAKRMQHGFMRGLVENAERFEGRCEHIYFHDFKEDYHESVERVFALIGKPYDDARRAAVQKQAESHSRGRQGARLVYDLETDFGITRDEIRDEFSYYLDKFPVKVEDTHQ